MNAGIYPFRRSAGGKARTSSTRPLTQLLHDGNLLRRQRQTGQLAALPGRGGPARCLEAAAQAWLGEQVAAQTDATLAELQTRLLVERGQAVSRGSVWRVLHEQGWRRKKKPARHRARYAPGARLA